MAFLVVVLMTLIAAAPGGATSLPAPATEPTVGAREIAPLSIQWTAAPPMPVAVAGHAVAATPAGPLAVGGTSWDHEQKRWHAEAWLFDVASQQWLARDPLPHQIGYAAAGTVRGDLFLAGGGSTGSGGARNAALVYPLSNRARDVVAVPDVPTARLFAGGGAVDGWLMVVGGASDADTLAGVTDVAVRLKLGEAKRAWEPAAPVPGGPLILPASAVCGGRLYLFGGMSSPDGGPLKDTARAACYRPDLNRWEPVAPLPSPRRCAAAVALDDRFVAIVGGCTTRGDAAVMLDEVILYDTREDRYHAAARLPYAAACVGAVLGADGRLYVCGGEDKRRSRTAAAAVGTLVRTTAKRQD